MATYALIKFGVVTQASKACYLQRRRYRCRCMMCFYVCHIWSDVPIAHFFLQYGVSVTLKEGWVLKLWKLARTRSVLSFVRDHWHQQVLSCYAFNIVMQASLTGQFEVYDTDYVTNGGTLLYTSPTVTVAAGDVWQFTP